MPHEPIDELIDALRASPVNATVFSLLVEACREADDSGRLNQALAISNVPRGALKPAVRLQVAQVLAAVDPSTALGWLTPEDAEHLLLSTRLLLALGRDEEARVTYANAMQRNAALEDSELAARLAGKVLAFPGGRRSDAVRSIANDDTDALEAARLLQPAAERVTFEDVGGLEEVKQQIRRRIVTPFLKPSLFERFKRKAGGGILMYGPPGCGKTLLARATAGECGANFYNVAISDVLDMYVGESERKLHAIFDAARSRTPAVLFFDEVEALGGKRQFARESTTSKLVSLFLSELDGFAQDNKGVLILGATNTPWAIDPAFRRPGRFDRVMFVPPPDQSARRAILAALLRERPHDPDLDLTDVCRRTSGFSGADLRFLVETATDEAIEASMAAGRETPIRRGDLQRALDGIRPTTSEWLTTARNYARYSNENRQYDEVLEFLRRNGTPA